MTDRQVGVSDDEADRRQAADEAQTAERTAADMMQNAPATSTAADSLDRAADFHVKAARTYDDGAEQRPEREDEFRDHAMRHRQLAHDDRAAAQRMREIADE